MRQITGATGRKHFYQSMKRNDLQSAFPNSSADFLARNTGKIAKLESDSRDAPLGEKKVQGRTGQKFHIRIKSFRKRLIDEDNLCAKYHTDLCRYAGILPDDAPGICKIEVSQVKTAKGETEKTLIEVFEI